MAGVLSPLGGAGWQFFTNAGVVLSGGQLLTYGAGSTTPLAAYTDSTLVTPLGNPIVLNAYGRPSGEIWLQNGVAYKFVLQDANSNVIGTWDNVIGINSLVAITNEWVSNNLVPTYVSATQFTVPGNQTAIFTATRRVQSGLSSGYAYGTVTAASYDGISATTVTVLQDSTPLNSTLSAVNYGLLNPAYPSIPSSYITGAVLYQAFAGRNRLANGLVTFADYQLTSLTTALTTTMAYRVNRWAASQAGTANGSLSQVAASAGMAAFGLEYNLKLARTAAAVTTGVMTVAQPIFSNNSWSMQGQPIAFSFYAYAGANFSAASSQITVKVYAGTGTDQTAVQMIAGSWTTSSTPISTAQSITTIPTRYTFTGVIPAGTNQVGVSIAFTPVGTAGADDAVYLGGLQLEVGTQATSLEVLDYSLQAPHARFACRPVGTNGNSQGVGMCTATTTALVQSIGSLFRTGVFPTYAGTTAQILNSAGTGVATTAATYYGADANGTIPITFTVASGLVAGNATLWAGGAGVLSAEI